MKATTDTAEKLTKKNEQQEAQISQKVGKDFQTDNPFINPAQMKKANPFEQATQMKSASEKSGMPQDVQGQMEGYFKTDFSDVNIHENSSQASKMGALAYTQGNDVHFAQGKFDASSQSGKQLLGHELSHVVQQRAGNVKPNTSVGGMAVNNDAQLEAQADSQGAAAASFSASQGASQMKLAKSGADNSNAPAQMKIDTYDQYYQMTNMGMFATRGDQTGGIDTIMKEYVNKKKEAGQFKGEASNKVVLTNLLSAAERDIAWYIKTNTDSKNKTQKGRALKFQSVLGELTGERATLDTEANAYTARKNPPANPIKITSQIATDQAAVTAAIEAEEQALTGGVPTDQEAGTDEAQKEIDKEEGEQKFDENSGLAGSLDDNMGIVDDVLGGDDRSGLADFDRDAAEEGKEEKEGVAGANGKEIKGFGKDAKVVFGYTADSIGTTKSAIMLGYYMKKMFQQGFSAHTVFNTLKSVAALGENGLSLASKIAGSAGADAASKTLEGVGNGFAIASAFLEVFSSVKKVYQLFSESKDAEEQRVSAQASGNFAKMMGASDKMAAIGEMVKSIVVAGLKVTKFITEDIPGPVLDMLPGIDIALAGIAFIQKGATMISTKISLNEIKRNQNANKEELGAGKVSALDTIMRQEKDLRAKKANLEMLYESDGELLRTPGTPMTEKKKIMDRRAGTKKAMDQVEGALAGKETESEAGMTDEQKVAVQEYKTSSALQEEYEGRYPELVVGMITDGMRIAGGMMVLLGPAAPYGAILKGVAGAIDLGMKAGKMIVQSGRDSKAKDRAIGMSQNAKGGGDVTGERAGEGAFAFNENKSSFAKDAEKKNLLAGLFKQVATYPKMGSNLAAARAKNGTDKAALAAYQAKDATQKSTLEEGKLTTAERTSLGGVQKLEGVEKRMMSTFSLSGVNLKAALTGGTPQSQFKLIAKRVMTTFK